MTNSSRIIQMPTSRGQVPMSSLAAPLEALVSEAHLDLPLVTHRDELSHVVIDANGHIDEFATYGYLVD